MVETGGTPETFVRCTECGHVYPAQRLDGEYRPVGTRGECRCGNDEFVPVT